MVLIKSMVENIDYRVSEKLQTLDKECYIYKELMLIRFEKSYILIFNSFHSFFKFASSLFPQTSSVHETKQGTEK